MFENQCVELRHDLGMAAQREIGVDPLLERGEPPRLQLVGRDRRERLGIELAERSVAPERQAFAQQRRSSDRIIGRSGLVTEPIEAVEVERSGRDGQ